MSTGLSIIWTVGMFTQLVNAIWNKAIPGGCRIAVNFMPRMIYAHHIHAHLQHLLFSFRRKSHLVLARFAPNNNSALSSAAYRRAGIIPSSWHSYWNRLDRNSYESFSKHSIHRFISHAKYWSRRNACAKVAICCWQSDALSEGVRDCNDLVLLSSAGDPLLLLLLTWACSSASILMFTYLKFRICTATRMLLAAILKKKFIISFYWST